MMPVQATGLLRMARWLLSAALSLPILGLIRVYRLFISPLLGSNCRHLPTCSEYAQDAIRMHGPLRGGYYALKRISRCHPWALPALDPVPPVKTGMPGENGMKPPQGSAKADPGCAKADSD